MKVSVADSKNAHRSVTHLKNCFLKEWLVYEQVYIAALDSNNHQIADVIDLWPV